jgi:beta-N-acetylhexosaminidase
MKTSILAGQLIIGGFHGTRVTQSFRDAVARGERGGAILFSRNLEAARTFDTLEACRALVADIASAAPRDQPLLTMVDQEGGRVARLKAPALVVPPMRRLGDKGDAALVRRVARAQAEELAALGFTMGATPVLDVDTNPQNPVIGDRSFSRDAETVARFALACAQGIGEGGVLSCGKHFPGHGDTMTDSHLELPHTNHDRARLDRVELLPFARAATAKVDSLMTAHVVFEALDPGVPATQSRAICTDLLRGELGFGGVLMSDDLEMKAIASDTGEAAVLAVRAGCDMLLVCSSEERQEEALRALVREAESSAAFKARCEEALGRAIAMRRRRPPRAVGTAAELERVLESHRALQRELDEAFA